MKKLNGVSRAKALSTLGKDARRLSRGLSPKKKRQVWSLLCDADDVGRGVVPIGWTEMKKIIRFLLGFLFFPVVLAMVHFCPLVLLSLSVLLLLTLFGLICAEDDAPGGWG